MKNWHFYFLCDSKKKKQVIKTLRIFFEDFQRKLMLFQIYLIKYSLQTTVHNKSDK